MKAHEKRITATYLMQCSPDRAYDWLNQNCRGKLAYPYREELVEERKVLEYLLCRRKNSLVDLGLARYGYTPYAIKSVFYRGNSGVRGAVLSNAGLAPLIIKGSLLQDEPVIDLIDLIGKARRAELEALALNPHLPDDFYINLIERKEFFSSLSEKNYKLMLISLGENHRLSSPYDETWRDGWSDYKYHAVFTAAWNLAAKVPATQEWAAILTSLLRNAKPPTSFENLEEALQRWQIDPPRKDPERYYNPGYGFYLRSRLADLFLAEKVLLDSPDLAVRQSFYRRFSPQKFSNWPDFLNKDGQEFVFEAIENLNLWQSEKERLNLQAVVWECPDPHSTMDMPNLYRVKEKKLKEEHPDWFGGAGKEDNSEIQGSTQRLVGALLRVIGGKS
jgi:hypothetical protein